MKKLIATVLICTLMITALSALSLISASAYNELHLIYKDGSLYYPDSRYYNGPKGNVTNITILDSVTSIGDSAFENCISLTSITIPDGVTSIGDNAFSGCTSLKYNKYDNANYLGNATNPYSVLINAISTTITSCDIHNNTKSIANSAFKACESLTSIEIPKSVSYIIGNPFRGCYSLESITAENGNKYYHSIDNCLIETATNGLIFGCKNSVIPNSVTSIGDGAFYSCTSLTSITIPDGVTSIGDGAFYNCTSLTSITIPDGVTSIGEDAFNNCYNLTSIEIPNSVTSIGYDAFHSGTKTFTCHANHLYRIPSDVENLTITGVSEFEKGHLERFTRLIELTIPFAGRGQNDTEYTYFAWIFYHYSSVIKVPYTLKKVTLTDALRIDNECFSGCSYIEEIILNEGVKEIGEKAFNGCLALTTVTIPKSVHTVAFDAFSQCNKLTTIRCYRNTEGEKIAKLLDVNIEYLDPICQTHNFGEWEIISDASCGIEGSQTRTCTACGSVETQAIPQLSHEFVFGGITKEATETSTGISVDVCQHCGYMLETVIPMITPVVPPETSDVEISDVEISDAEISDAEISDSVSIPENDVVISTADENGGEDNTIFVVIIGILLVVLIAVSVFAIILIKKSKGVPPSPIDTTVEEDFEAEPAEEPTTESVEEPNQAEN